MLRALLKRVALRLVPECYRDLDAQRADINQALRDYAAGLY